MTNWWKQKLRVKNHEKVNVLNWYYLFICFRECQTENEKVIKFDLLDLYGKSMLWKFSALKPKSLKEKLELWYPLSNVQCVHSFNWDFWEHSDLSPDISFIYFARLFVRICFPFLPPLFYISARPVCWNVISIMALTSQLSNGNNKIIIKIWTLFSVENITPLPLKWK